MKLVIFGPPGSGKGTYASRLQTRLGVDVVATGDLLREIMREDTPLGRKVKGFVEKGLLVPDDVVVQVLKQRLEKSSSRGFILDGFPRTVEQAKTLERLVTLDGVILLSVPDWMIIERLSTRRICRSCGEVYNVRFLRPKKEGVCDKCGGQLYQRSDDTPEVIRERIGVYERQTEPVLQYYRDKKVPFVELRCESFELTPEAAVDIILKELERLKLARRV